MSVENIVVLPVFGDAEESSNSAIEIAFRIEPFDVMPRWLVPSIQFLVVGSHIFIAVVGQIPTRVDQSVTLDQTT